MSSQPKIPQALLQHALLLLTRQQAGSAEVARRAREDLNLWRQAAPAHEQAYQAAFQAWGSLHVADLKQHMALPQAAANRGADRTRRGLLGIVGLAGLYTAARWLLPTLNEPRLVQTGAGQMLAETLADGSRVDLGARSSMTVRFTADTRLVRLDTGDVRFSVTKDAARPFVVDTQWGSVRVLGTEFAVSASAQHMYVAVAEGLVEVTAATRAGARTAADSRVRVRLTRGDAIRIGEDGVSALSRVDPDNVGAWRDGWLVFDDTDLVSAIRRWNDYTSGAIRFREQDAAMLGKYRVTGGFFIANHDAFVNSLPKILPVRVNRNESGVWVQPR